VRRTRKMVVLVGLIAAPLGAAAGVAAESRGTAKKPVRFNLISRATAINNLVDTGPAGASPGDLYVFSDRVSRPQAPDSVIGRFEGHCTLLDPAAARWDCAVVTSLREGTIRSAGQLILKEGSINRGAVVGGSGRYRNARGEGSVELGPFMGPHRLHYELIITP
jgi:hypothetical protein